MKLEPVHDVQLLQEESPFWGLRGPRPHLGFSPASRLESFPGLLCLTVTSLSIRALGSAFPHNSRITPAPAPHGPVGPISPRLLTLLLCCCFTTKSRLTLCNHMDYSPPSSSVRGLPQARILEEVAISFFWGSSCPRDQTCISCIAR